MGSRAAGMRAEELEHIELELVIQVIARRWGYDLRDYAMPSLRRRVQRAAAEAGAPRLSAVIDRLLHDEVFFEGFFARIFVSVTELFRDPDFFLTLRQQILPELATYPRPAIWHAGCATGEEVYSMAILLQEEGLLSRTRLYGTDVNLQALHRARTGVYPLADIMGREHGYRRAGGTGALGDHVVISRSAGSSNGALCMMGKRLREHITWSHHNLCSDGPFAEVNLVLCRNTLIYFERHLQERVLDTFRSSLLYRGLLGLGSKESLDLAACREQFDIRSQQHRIYQKRNGVPGLPFARARPQVRT